MSIIKKILNKLDQPENNVAIIDISTIKGEFENVFEFIDEIEKVSTNEYYVELLEPDENEKSNKKNKIVLVTNPTKIKDFNFQGKKIYVVEKFRGLKRAYNKYRVTK